MAEREYMCGTYLSKSALNARLLTFCASRIGSETSELGTLIDKENMNIYLIYYWQRTYFWCWAFLPFDNWKPPLLEALEDAAGAVETRPGAVSLFAKAVVGEGSTAVLLETGYEEDATGAVETGPGAVALFAKAGVEEAGILLFEAGYELLAEPKPFCGGEGNLVSLEPVEELEWEVEELDVELDPMDEL